MKPEQIVKSAEEALKQEGKIFQESENGSADLLAKFILPGLVNSKDTLGDIYFKVRSRGGFVGKIKSKIQSVIVSTTINVVEKQSMKQQKFNSLTTKAIEALVQENEELKKRLEKLEDGSSS